MKSTLKITVKETEPGQTYQLIKFDGEFDKAGQGEVKEQLDTCVKDFNLQSLVFDFTDLEFINSEGIGYLMEVHTHLAQRGRKLVILGINAHVKDVFQAIGLIEIIPLYDGLKDFLSK